MSIETLIRGYILENFLFTDGAATDASTTTD